MEGNCVCGGINYIVTAKSVRSVLCHCKDCRKAHSSPLYNCAYFPKEFFQILKGESLLKYYQGKNQNLQRYFCSNCGTRVFNSLIKDGVQEVGVFPSLFKDKVPEIYNPIYHVWTSEACLPMELFENDNLRKNTHSNGHQLNKVISRL